MEATVAAAWKIDAHEHRLSGRFNINLVLPSVHTGNFINSISTQDQNWISLFHLISDGLTVFGTIKLSMNKLERSLELSEVLWVGHLSWFRAHAKVLHFLVCISDFCFGHCVELPAIRRRRRRRRRRRKRRRKRRRRRKREIEWERERERK